MGDAEPGRRSRSVARRRIALTGRRTAARHGAGETPSLAAQDRDRAAGGADHRRPGTVGAGRSGARRRSGGVPTHGPRCVVRRAPMMVEPLRRRDGEATAGACTPEPKRGEDTRYHYYVSRGCGSSYAVFVCDHAYDCEPLCREASEQEVVALIGPMHCAQRKTSAPATVWAPSACSCRWSHHREDRSAERARRGRVVGRTTAAASRTHPCTTATARSATTSASR